MGRQVSGGSRVDVSERGHLGERIVTRPPAPSSASRSSTSSWARAIATMAEAEDRRAAYDELSTLVDDLPLLSEGLNFDFASRDLDEPLSDDDLDAMSGIQGIRNQVLQITRRANPTVRDFVQVSGRGRLVHPTVGGPVELADHFEKWFTERVVDGFVIAGTHMPGAFEDFVELVVPELQRRGLFRTEYRSTTLRDHLGMQVPEPSSWRLA